MKDGRCVVDYADYNQQGNGDYGNSYYSRKTTTARDYQWYENVADYDSYNSGSDSSGGSGGYGKLKNANGKPCAVRVETFASYKVCLERKKVRSIECGQELCTRGRCKCQW